MTLEDATAKIATLTEQLRVERDRHQEKDRLYTKGLADLKAWCEKALAAETERHDAERKKLAEQHDKALAAALAETPEARAHREELAAIQADARKKVQAAAAKFKAGVKT